MPYTAEMFGDAWKQGPKAEFTTIHAARAWAEEYGTAADSCTIYDARGRAIARHVRNTNGNRPTWYRSEP